MSTATVPPVAIDPDLARDLTRAADRIERLTEERNKLVLRAFAQGASLREIAKLAGMTHVGVKKLVDRIEADFMVRTSDGTYLIVIEAKTSDAPDRHEWTIVRREDIETSEGYSSLSGGSSTSPGFNASKTLMNMSQEAEVILPLNSITTGSEPGTGTGMVSTSSFLR